MRSEGETFHRDGALITPAWLGDFADMVDDGLYTSLTVKQLESRCVTTVRKHKSEIISSTQIRISASGVKAVTDPGGPERTPS